jgi:hypothetical protein
MNIKLSIEENKYNYGMGLSPYSMFIKTSIADPNNDFFEAFSKIEKQASNDIILYGDFFFQIKELEVFITYLISKGYHVSCITRVDRFLPYLILNRWIIFLDSKKLQSSVKSLSMLRDSDILVLDAESAGSLNRLVTLIRKNNEHGVQLFFDSAKFSIQDSEIANVTNVFPYTDPNKNRFFEVTV